MMPATIKANYREWRRAIVTAIRIERMNGLQPRRRFASGMKNRHRDTMARELWERRKQLKGNETPKFTVWLVQDCPIRTRGYLTIDGELAEMRAPGEPEPQHMLTLEQIAKGLTGLDYEDCKLVKLEISRETE